MKTLIATILALWFVSAAYCLPFSFSYVNVYDANADDYVVSQTNIQKRNEGLVHYYSPSSANTAAQITYRFALGGTITDAYLFAHLASYNFGSSNGFGSLWGSKDGSSWELLMDAPTTGSAGMGYFYDQNLPGSLLGGSDIWIQARLQSNSGTIFSQFSRTDTRFPTEVFQFRATTTTVPEAGTSVVLFGIGVLGIWLFRRTTI